MPADFESLVSGPQRVIIDIPAGEEITIARTSGVRVQVVRSTSCPQVYRDMPERFDIKPHPDLVLQRIDLTKPFTKDNLRWVEKDSVNDCRGK